MPNCCPACAELRCFIHADTLAFARTYTKANMRVDSQGGHVAICPECDACALMLEYTWGVPIYSRRDEAIITVHDYGAVDEAALLEFGNLRFSTRAIEGALQMRRLIARRQSKPDADVGIEPLERHLLGPTGIPDDDFAGDEWVHRLQQLAAQLMEKPALPLLDAAIRTVIEQVPSSVKSQKDFESFAGCR